VTLQSTKGRRAELRRSRRANAAAPMDGDGRRLLAVAGKTFLLYQVYYDAESERRLDPLSTPFRNILLTPFFESSVIEALLASGSHRPADYFGVMSWKIRSKIPLSFSAILSRIERDGCSADVYSFFGHLGVSRLWAMAERKHPGILRAAQMLMHRLRIDVDLAQLEAPPIYQNHFIARSPMYERFGRELLAPALKAMQDAGDTELQRLIQQDACYIDPRVAASLAMQLYGKPHLCLHPFICERLFSTWLALNPTLRVHHVWRGRFVEPHNVGHEPEMRRATVPR
jgi:hypothetical protein